MSTHVASNIELLKALCKMNSKQRKEFLKYADSDLLLAICEIALNTLKGNVSMSNDQKKILSRFKKFLRLLAHKRVSIKRKKKYLVQTGGSIFLPLLLNIALSTVASALTDKIF